MFVSLMSEIDSRQLRAVSDERDEAVSQDWKRVEQAT